MRIFSLDTFQVTDVFSQHVYSMMMPEFTLQSAITWNSVFEDIP